MGNKLSVASSVSNLGGEFEDRPQILKQIVVGGILSHTDRTLSEVLSSSYLHGGGVKLRNFFKWAKKSGGYNSIVGGSSSTLSNQTAINLPTIEPFIPRNALYESITVLSAKIETDMAVTYGTLWMKENYPLQMNTDWGATYITATNEFEVILEDGTPFRFIQPDYAPNSRYLVAEYAILTTLEPIEHTVFGVWIDIYGNMPFVPIGLQQNPPPASEGWVEIERTSVDIVVPLRTRTQNGGYISPREQIVTLTQAKYERITFIGQVVGSTAKLYKKELIEFKEEYEVYENGSYTVNGSYTDAQGVTHYTSTKYYPEAVRIILYGKLDEFTLRTKLDTNYNLFIYKEVIPVIPDENAVVDPNAPPIYEGIPEVNSLFPSEYIPDDGYFPYIPLRIDNVSIEDNPDVYPWCKKAYYRAFGENKFQKLLNKLEANPDLSKMDYAYIVFGCSLNTSDYSSLEYIYRLFDRLEQLNGNGVSEYSQYQQQQLDWQVSPVNPANTTWFWAVPDIHLVITSPPTSTITSKIITVGSNENPVMNYNVSIKWDAIDKRHGTGVARANAQMNDLWIGTPPVSGALGSAAGSYSIIWQYATDAWKSVTIFGLEHTNKVYRDKSVVTSGVKALTEYPESGFIIPLNYTIFREMSLVRATQFSVSCRYMVVNAYEIRKQKWWEKWWGILIITLVTVAIGMATGMIGATTVGLFGTSASVGAAVGLTGTAAVLLGSVINIAVASILLQKVATPLLGKLLGDKWASILLPIIMLTIPSAIGGAGVSVTALFQPENLLRLTDAAINSYTNYTTHKIADIGEEMRKQADQFALESKQLSDKYQEQFGNGAIELNVGKRIVAETADEFFARTQLTGSDIVELSKSFLNADVMRQIDTML